MSETKSGTSRTSETSPTGQTKPTSPTSRTAEPTEGRPRLLIEEWLPAAAIGVECMRERNSASALAPTTYLHVWWARRPLCISRAAVLGSLLPAGFPHDVFERLLGFGRPSADIVSTRRLMDLGVRVHGGFGCDRAFKGRLASEDLERLGSQLYSQWATRAPMVLDPMAGGGSIPLEAARLGLDTVASELNPVACVLLEATVRSAFHPAPMAGVKAREWGAKLIGRLANKLSRVYPRPEDGTVHAYIFARTVRCPDTGYETPLVPDWHLLNKEGKTPVVASPIVDKARGTWRCEIRNVSNTAGDLHAAPPPTYANGTGYSLFTAPTNAKGEPTGRGRPIPSEWIKAEAQAGRMGSVLYAVAVKTGSGLQFRPPIEEDLKALEEAEKELERFRPDWEKRNILPNERVPEGDKTKEVLVRGITTWRDMFTPRQLLAMGVLVEELQRLRTEIVKEEGEELGEAVVHLLALAIDKFLNHNCNQTRFENTRGVIKGKMDRHDYAFKATFAEMAACAGGAGLEWALDNVLEAYEEIAKLPKAPNAKPATVIMGSATSLPQIEDGTVHAVVVDPPYHDNVQYSELADFFYVWLKRTQGHRRPEWFGSYLCPRDQEAVVNLSRHREPGGKTNAAKQAAQDHYQQLMSQAFRECRRVLRDDGALTVMFTHKKQEAWMSLFASLIAAGFVITASWPVKTESEHSLHIAKKNSAESTVVLVCRKRLPGAGRGYYDRQMRAEIEAVALETAARLEREGLNKVDQLLGAYGPAMTVFSRYDEVVTDTGQPVDVARALEIASDAVMRWRVDQLAEKGIEGVEPEGRFALLCWDVLGAEEFRFNEAKLLGHAVGMDVDRLVLAGLVTKDGEKIRMVPATSRRRDRALSVEEATTLFNTGIEQPAPKRRRKADVLKVHPSDPQFRTAIDACHAAALAYLEAGGEGPGLGVVRSLARRHAWTPGGTVARLMEALVRAAPLAVRHEGKAAAKRFPEFRAWHAILPAVFGIEVPDWREPEVLQKGLFERTEELDEPEVPDESELSDEDEEDAEE